MVEPLVELKGIQPGIRPNPSETVNTQNSYGRSTEIKEGQSEQIVRVQLPDQMGVFLVSVRAIDVDKGTNPTVVYPRALIQWGNGNVLNSDIVDATGGVQQVVVGTTVQVKVFLSDAAGNAPENGSGASATFFANASWGITPYPERNTTFFRDGGTATGVLVPLGGGASPVQGRTFGFRGTADVGTAVFIQFFDKSTAPAVGDIPFAEAAIQSGVTQWQLPFANTKSFLHGLAWGLSSTPLVYTASAETAVSVYAEIANNG